MALWSEVEAALEMGISVELLRKFTKVCPKTGQSRLLAVTDVGGVPHFQSDEVSAYAAWLRQPWPKGANQQRPHIPEYIKADVRQECHHACAICGLMESGEVAHIAPVADTFDNSPDNLILLCPNHHTKYDYGYKPSSNVTRAEILAAKTIKRSSRQRMMRYEANAVVQLKHMVLLL
jgi:5-methylcytosine-specific restriction endonuclease McrA